MAKSTYTISEIREAITRLPEQFEEEPEAVAITRHGKPVMAILPWDLYESIIETMEILGDAELMAAFRQGVQDIAEGRVEPWEDVRRELGWE
jgi:antitoxin YefM